MGNVVDFPKPKQGDQPDADCVRLDEEGQPLYLFGLAYFCGDATYSLQIWARSEDEAQARVGGMNETGIVLVGQIYAAIPLTSTDIPAK